MENWIEMQVVTVCPTGRDRKFAYEIQLSLHDIGFSKWILIPEDVSLISVGVDVDFGTTEVYAEATLESLAKVKAGTAENTIKWSKGNVRHCAHDVCKPVTAIRLVQTLSGNSDIRVRAQ